MIYYFDQIESTSEFQRNSQFLQAIINYLPLLIQLLGVNCFLEHSKA